MQLNSFRTKIIVEGMSSLDKIFKQKELDLKDKMSDLKENKRNKKYKKMKISKINKKLTINKILKFVEFRSTNR